MTFGWEKASKQVIQSSAYGALNSLWHKQACEMTLCCTDKLWTPSLHNLNELEHVIHHKRQIFLN